MLSINEYLDYIYNDEPENNKKIVYIAVGSAHHMMRIMNGQKIIDEQYDQQYPIFLRNIKRNHPDYKIYIVLIDPMLEVPCFTVSNKYINDGIIFDEKWEKHRDHENVFLNGSDNIVLFEYREYIRYSSEENEYENKTIVIESHLDALNNIAMLEKWFVILMDFTGRYLHGITMKYDKVLGSDVDHIFYGLPSRIDGGCYIDLSDKNNSIITSTEKGYLTAFTPYAYSNTDLYKLYKELIIRDDAISIIKRDQIRISLKRILDCYKNDVVNLYRRLFINKKNLLEGVEPIIFSDREFNFVQNKYNLLDIKDKINNLELIDELIGQISEIVDLEFYHIVDFFDKKELLPKFVEAKSVLDPYKMNSEIFKIVNELFNL